MKRKHIWLPPTQHTNLRRSQVLFLEKSTLKVAAAAPFFHHGFNPLLFVDTAKGRVTAQVAMLPEKSVVASSWHTRAVGWNALRLLFCAQTTQQWLCLATRWSCSTQMARATVSLVIAFMWIIVKQLFFETFLQCSAWAIRTDPFWPQVSSTM